MATGRRVSSRTLRSNRGGGLWGNKFIELTTDGRALGVLVRSIAVVSP